MADDIAEKLIVELKKKIPIVWQVKPPWYVKKMENDRWYPWNKRWEVFTILCSLA